MAERADDYAGYRPTGFPAALDFPGHVVRDAEVVVGSADHAAWSNS